MQNEEGKHLRLFGVLLLCFLGFITLLILLFLFMKLVFGFFNYFPALNTVYLLFIVCVPAMLFIPVFLVYWKLTKRHPSAGARVFSYIIFTGSIATWLFFLISDLILFFTKHFANAGQYRSYNMYYLAVTIFLIFLTGIVQAFATPKEKHWLEKLEEKR